MVRGIQSAAAGMIAQQAGQDIIANNLANANTAGFKRDVPSFGAVLAGKAGAAPLVQSNVTSGSDTSQGALKQTGNPFNMALDGDGFFEVQTPNGTPAYTRNGDFTRSRDGYLMTSNGDKVMGNAGPVRVAGTNFRVSGQGVIEQPGGPSDTFRVVKFPQGSKFQRGGGGLYRPLADKPVPAPSTQVRQGYLEASNVNPVVEMVSMISGFRGYEASQKAIQAQDETLDKLANDVGRVG